MPVAPDSCKTGNPIGPDDHDGERAGDAAPQLNQNPAVFGGPSADPALIVVLRQPLPGLLVRQAYRATGRPRMTCADTDQGAGDQQKGQRNALMIRPRSWSLYGFTVAGALPVH